MLHACDFAVALVIRLSISDRGQQAIGRAGWRRQSVRVRIACLKERIGSRATRRRRQIVGLLGEGRVAAQLEGESIIYAIPSANDCFSVESPRNAESRLPVVILRVIGGTTVADIGETSEDGVGHS